MSVPPFKTKDSVLSLQERIVLLLCFSDSASVAFITMRHKEIKKRLLIPAIKDLKSYFISITKT